MAPESAMGIALVGVAVLIGLPAFGAWRRRVVSREASRVAEELQAFAFTVRKARRREALPFDLLNHLESLRSGVPEIIGFLVTQQLAQLTPESQADAAQRLALRLKRRVAFERKMLARTAAGLKRGAAAAAVPPLVVLTMAGHGAPLPLPALGMLFALEALGCWLLWRTVRVEV
jgi:hypothetical protein